MPARPTARARSCARSAGSAILELLACDEMLNRPLTSNDKAIGFPFNPQEAARGFVNNAITPCEEVNVEILIAKCQVSFGLRGNSVMLVLPLLSLLRACKSPVHFCRVRCV